MTLFVDDWVKRQGFASTEEYLAWCLEERIPAHFMGPVYFTSLLKKSILIPELTRVRVKGPMDSCYLVREDGSLEGLALMAHSGREGRHTSSILDPVHSPEGWEIENYRRP